MRLKSCSASLVLIVSLILPGVMAFPIGPPSYSCDAELNRVERIVCDSEVLSYIDRNFSVVYQYSVDAFLYQDGTNVRDAQRAWLKQRDRCETVECIGEMYLYRTSVLDPGNLMEYGDEAFGYWISYQLWLQHTDKTWSSFEQFIETHGRPDVQQEPHFADGIDPGSMLVIDLDGDGVETVGFEKKIHFDHDGDGFAELTGFVHPDDGILVFDRNGDGVISDGSEFFGTATVLANGTYAENGFQTLTVLDSNGDGYVSINDEDYFSLRVWQDMNQDGVPQTWEIYTLSDAGIMSLLSRYSNQSYMDEYGNEYQLASIYWNVDGLQRELINIRFSRDMSNNKEIMIPVPNSIAALPDATGFGNIHSLHQAMARDESGELQQLVEQFVSSTSSDERQALLEPILFKWTGQEGEYRPYYQSSIDERKIKTMEALAGREIGRPNGSGQSYATLFEAEFYKVEDILFYQLSARTHLKPIFEKITWAQDDASGAWLGDFSRVYGELLDLLEENFDEGSNTLNEFARALSGINVSGPAIQDQFRQQLSNYLASEDFSGYSKRSIDQLSQF